VPDLLLHDNDQVALACLLATRPVPGTPLPPRDVLDLLLRLVHGDAAGALWCSPDGDVLDRVDQPRGGSAGVRCLADLPEAPPGRGCRTMTVLLRNPSRHPVVMWFHRNRPFDERDAAMLRMLRPALQRLVAERPLVHAERLSDLTSQELRVLKLVGAGCTNAEIAAHLSVATATVRKHLEHAYRKLGVSGRLGALAVLQGRDLPELDLKAQVDRFA
jgi:DNA-binding CsgD family transcriptional regulator